MSRHKSSPAEQILGLLFLVIAVPIAIGRFIWNLYTSVPNDDEKEGHQNNEK